MSNKTTHNHRTSNFAFWTFKPSKMIVEVIIFKKIENNGVVRAKNIPYIAKENATLISIY